MTSLSELTNNGQFVEVEYDGMPADECVHITACHEPNGYAPLLTGRVDPDRPDEAPHKKPWYGGHHGYGALTATSGELRGLIGDVVRRMVIGRQAGLLNLALRLPPGVIGLDVDNYDGKRGGLTLAEHEARLGALPPTYALTARDPAQGSGIRLYAVPDDWAGVGELPGGHVDLIQPHLRFVMAPGSLHHTGQRYQLYDPSVRVDTAGVLPARTELPPLPELWQADLYRRPRQRGRPGRPGEPATSADVAAFADEYTFDEYPHMLPKTVRDVRATGSDGRSTRNAARTALFIAAHKARAGCYPWRRARDEIEAAATAAYADRGRELDPYEFERLVEHAVTEALVKTPREVAEWGGRAAAQALAADPDETAARAAGAGSVETYRIAKHAIQNGGIPMKQLGDRADTETPASAPAGDVGPTWAPVDMRTARRDQQASVPTLGRRIDGEFLFYPGKVHWLHGETESGKSWLAQYTAAQCLSSSEADAVLYVDFEDNAADVAARLIALGVPGEVVDDPARFAYVRPEFAPDIERERNAFDALLTRRFAFAVIDGVTESMAMARLSDNDTADVATWQLQQPRAIASRTGAGVVCIDHVTKDADTRGRHAIGSQHKLAGLDGAAFVMGMSEPFGVGLAGVATVRVGKDRPGQVRRFGVDYSPKEQTHVVAKFRLDATDPDSIAAALMAPAAGETQPPRGKTAKAGRRPTWEMEQVSKYWDDTAEAGERTHNKTVAAMYRRHAGTDKESSRQAWRDAVGLLADEGYAERDDGPNNSKRYRNAKPYREADDPKCERRRVVIPMRREADDGPKS